MLSAVFTILSVFVVLLILFVFYCRYTLNGGLYRRYCDHIATDLHGKTAIIAGGNAGIGKATAIDLARRGARVIIGCRNPTKAKEAVKDIQRVSGSSNVVFHKLELSDQESVRNFAETLLKQEQSIHYLINNAGIVAAEEGRRTKEGCDMVFAVNHFGHFLLTMLLLDRLKECAPSRIINLTSIHHASVKEGEFQFVPKDKNGHVYPSLCGYPRSKLANVLFTRELARQLHGSGVTTYSVHPGAILSSIITRESPKMSFFQHLMFVIFFWCIASDERAGAQTTIYCILSKSITHVSGRYFDNCSLAPESELGKDDGLAKKLWDVSCQATCLD